MERISSFDYYSFVRLYHKSNLFEQITYLSATSWITRLDYQGADLWVIKYRWMDIYYRSTFHVTYNKTIQEQIKNIPIIFKQKLYKNTCMLVYPSDFLREYSKIMQKRYVDKCCFSDYVVKLLVYLRKLSNLASLLGLLAKIKV